MPTLVDTNVLLRYAQPGHPDYKVVDRALYVLRSRGETLCIAPQNLVEFWAVATRPRTSRGFGMTVTRARIELLEIRELFRILTPSLDVLDEWQKTVVGLSVLGKQTHDAHLVAMMYFHSIAEILTFNGADFSRYPGISVLDPAQF